MINIIQGFKIGSAVPVDERLLLTKEQMRNIDHDVMPHTYFAICEEDGLLYIYNKDAEENVETGKFIVVNPISDFEVLEDASVGYFSSTRDGLDVFNQKVAQLDLTSYAKHALTGHSVELSLDHATYVLTASLKNKDNEVISETSVDFPMEEMIVSIEYLEDSEGSYLLFTLRNGETLRVPLEAILHGIATELYVNDLVAAEKARAEAQEQALQERVAQFELNGSLDVAAISNKVDTNIEAIETISQDYLKKVDKEELQAKLDEKANSNNVYPKSDVDEKLQAKQDKLTAGAGVTIEDNVISITDNDTTYTGGNGITVENNEISINFDPRTLAMTSEGSLTVSQSGVYWGNILSDVDRTIENQEDLVQYIADKVKEEADRAQEVETSLETALSEGLAQEVEARNAAIKDETDRAAAAEKQNSDDIDALEGRMNIAEQALDTVDSRIETAITNANLGQYAKQADVTSTIETLESAYKAADSTLKAELTSLINAKASQTDLEDEINRAKAAEKVNADAIALLTNGADPETIDGVNDLINYVNQHGAEVTGMKADIKANAEAIADLEELVGTEPVADQIDAKIAAENLSQYAKQADLEGAIERIADLEIADGVQDGLLEGLRTDVDLKASQADLTVLDGRVGTAEGKLTTVEGKVSTLEGSLAEVLEGFPEDSEGKTSIINYVDNSIETSLNNLSQLALPVYGSFDEMLNEGGFSVGIVNASSGAVTGTYRCLVISNNTAIIVSENNDVYKYVASENGPVFAKYLTEEEVTAKVNSAFTFDSETGTLTINSL